MEFPQLSLPSHQLDSKEEAEATDTRQQAQRHVHDLEAEHLLRD